MKSLLLPTLILISSTAFANSNPLTLEGKFQQGSLIKAKTHADAKVSLDGKPVKVAPNGDFVFGFGRDAKVNHTLKVIFPDGTTRIEELQVKPQKYNIQKINGISKKIMKPDPEAVARAKQDSAQVWKARENFSTHTAVFEDFIWPLTGRISGVYGSQRVYNSKPGRPHYGVDVAAKTGTVVVSPANGVITLAVPDMFYSGGTIIIDHGYGVSSSMLHLSKLYVEVGQKVKQGESIAEVGATGRATGSHLDWRVNWFQTKLDPTFLVPAMSEVLKK